MYLEHLWFSTQSQLPAFCLRERISCCTLVQTASHNVFMPGLNPGVKLLEVCRVFPCFEKTPWLKGEGLWMFVQSAVGLSAADGCYGSNLPTLSAPWSLWNNARSSYKLTLFPPKGLFFSYSFSLPPVLKSLLVAPVAGATLLPTFVFGRSHFIGKSLLHASILPTILRNYFVFSS